MIPETIEQAISDYHDSLYDAYESRGHSDWDAVITSRAALVAAIEAEIEKREALIAAARREEREPLQRLVDAQYQVIQALKAATIKGWYITDNLIVAESKMVHARLDAEAIASLPLEAQP